MIKRKDFQAAAALLDKAFGALLGLEEGSTWDPRKSLLVAQGAPPT